MDERFRTRQVEPSSSPEKPKIKQQTLSDRIIPPISTQKFEYLKGFIASKLGQVEEKVLENALIVLGDGDAIRKWNVGPMTFQDLLSDAKSYCAVVHAYYDSTSGVLSYFSGRRPDEPGLRHVAFIVDFDRSIMGERIARVDFHDGPGNPSLKALEGMQVSGGFGCLRL